MPAGQLGSESVLQFSGHFVGQLSDFESGREMELVFERDQKDGLAVIVNGTRKNGVGFFMVENVWSGLKIWLDFIVFHSF